MADSNANIPKKLPIYILKAPYVCTIPRGGLHYVPCFPDAIQFFRNGCRCGWSPRKRTLIIPLNMALGDAISLLEDPKVWEGLEKNTKQRGS